MRIKYDPIADVYTVEGGPLDETLEIDSSVCDCMTFKYNSVGISPKRITIWNLLFNREVKNVVKMLKNEYKSNSINKS